MDFNEATKSDGGRWAWPALIATAWLDTGRDLVRPDSPNPSRKVEEGCRPWVSRPPAPWRRPVAVRKKKATMGRMMPDASVLPARVAE